LKKIKNVQINDYHSNINYRYGIFQNWKKVLKKKKAGRSAKSSRFSNSNVNLNSMIKHNEEYYDNYDYAYEQDDIIEQTLALSSVSRQPDPAETNKTALITWPELAQDVSKWVVYDLLLPDDIDNVPLDLAAKVGAMSGMLGNIVFFVCNRNNENKKSFESVVDNGDEGKGSELTGVVSLIKSNVTSFHSNNGYDITTNRTYLNTIYPVSQEQIMNVSDSNVSSNNIIVTEAQERNRKIVIDFLKSGLEGAALFASYEGSIQLLDSTTQANQDLNSFFSNKWF